jgi:putative transposase
MPAEHGDLHARITELASTVYRHPSTGEVIRFAFKTIQRWYYSAKDEADPIAALARKVPSHAGAHPSVSVALAVAIERQYRDHPRWSYQLHYDNLVALAKQDRLLGAVPGYATVRRFMRQRALLKQRRLRGKRAGGVREDGTAFEQRECRSFEVSHVHALWHLDFHEGSRRVLAPSGEWKTPMLLGVLDDRSRLCCHLQWYFDQSAESLVHGLSQAIQKRGLPRKLLTDNGAAMLAAETVEGLTRLGIEHETTLPYSPEQNAKQEVFWAQIEGRLLPMLEGEKHLTLALLNEATQAWVEGEYNRKPHSELDQQTPVERVLAGPTRVRPSPSSDALRRAFRFEASRVQRRSDGTVTVEGVRFELPSAYRTLTQITLRVARWDLTQIDLVDPRTGVHLAVLFPLDKQRNADGRRRVITPAAIDLEPRAPAGIAPHLRALMADYAATGLPPAYLPKHDHAAAHENDDGDQTQHEDRRHDGDHEKETL